MVGRRTRKRKRGWLLFYSYQGVRRRRGEEAAKVSGLCLVRGWQAAGIEEAVDGGGPPYVRA